MRRRTHPSPQAAANSSTSNGREATNVDLVVMAGGGGALYGRAVAALFPGAEVRLARDPVGDNARGFFLYGGR